MNNKGFTLVEILACLVVLGLIISLAVPSVIKFQKENEIKKYEATYENLKNNLELFNLDKENIAWNNDEASFTVEDLKAVNNNLEIDEMCSVENLKIRRNMYNENLYNYTYKVCLKCGKGRTTYISNDC